MATVNSRQTFGTGGSSRFMRTFRNALPWYLFIAPATLMLLTLMAYPLFDTLRLSLFKWGGLGPQSFVGLKNFSKLFGDEIFWRALGNSFMFSPSYRAFLYGVDRSVPWGGDQPADERVAGLSHCVLHSGDDVGGGGGDAVGEYV